MTANQHNATIGAKAQANKEPAPSFSSLPMKGFTAALLLTTAVFITLAAQAWFSFQSSEAHLEHDVRLFQLKGDIVFLEEAMTMSVRMAAATGQKRWLERHKILTQQFDQALAEVTRLAPVVGISDSVEQVRVASSRLVALERDVFARIEQGRFDDAKAVLGGETFRRQKEAYAEGIAGVVASMKGHLRQIHNQKQLRTFMVLAAVGVALPAMLCAWLYAIGSLRHHFVQRRRAELATQDSQRRLREQLAELELLYDTAPVGLCLLDTQLRYVRINERLAAINGLSVSDHIGRPMKEVIPNLAADVETICREVIRSGQPMVDQELRGVTPAQPNLRRDWNSGYFPLKDPAGHVIGVSAVFEDVTIRKRVQDALQEAHDELERWVERRTHQLAETNQRLKQEIVDRKKVEKALRRSEHELRVITDNITGLIAYVDSDMRYRFVNRRYAEWFGLPSDRILGNHPRHVMGQDAFEKSEGLMRRAFAGEEVSYEMERVLPNGQHRWVKANYVPDLDKEGAVSGIFVLVTDISDHKRTEQALQISEERFNLAVRGSSDGLWDWQIESGRVWWSPRYFEILGYDDGAFEVSYEKFTAFVHPDDRGRVDQAVQDHLRRRVAFDIEFQIASKSGDYMWVRARGQAIRDSGGTPTRMAGSVQDITARKQVETALRDNESRYRALYEDNPSMYFTVDADGVVLSVNRFGADQLGYAPQGLVGGSVLTIVHEADHDVVRKHLSRCLESPGQLFHWEFRKVRSDGSLVWVREAGRSIPGQDGRGAVVLIVCEDITYQKQAEDLMRIQTSVLEVTVKGTELTDTLNALCSYVERVVPQSICSIMLLEEKTGRLRMVAGPKVSANCASALNGLKPSEHGASCGTAAYRGKPVYVADTLTDPRWADFRQFAERFGIRGCWSVPIFDDGETVVGTFAISRSEPGKPSTFQRRVMETASRLAGIALGRQRTQDQVRQHQEELAHVMRLSTVGELASGLAHEINQPLAAISNYVEVCSGELRSGQWDRQEMIATMAKATSQCHRASQIINRLRYFLRKRAPRRSKVDLNHVIHEAIHLVQSDPRSNRVEFQLDLNEQLQPVEADGIQIEQVIINLAKNSLDAMAENRGHRRRLMIRTAPLDRQAVRVMLSDTGSGLPEGSGGKVFDPFFTTKPDGMGMGLSISRTIIEAHGGRMAVSGNPDRGVTFQFTLPTEAGVLT